MKSARAGAAISSAWEICAASATLRRTQPVPVARRASAGEASCGRVRPAIGSPAKPRLAQPRSSVGRISQIAAWSPNDRALARRASRTLACVRARSNSTKAPRCSRAKARRDSPPATRATSANSSWTSRPGAAGGVIASSSASMAEFARCASAATARRISWRVFARASLKRSETLRSSSARCSGRAIAKSSNLSFKRQNRSKPHIIETDAPRVKPHTLRKVNFGKGLGFGLAPGS